MKSPEVERWPTGDVAPPTVAVRLVDGGAAARSIGDRQTGAGAVVAAHAPAELVADQQTPPAGCRRCAGTCQKYDIFSTPFARWQHFFTSRGRL